MIAEKIAQAIQIAKDYHSDQVEVMAMKKEELLEWYNSICHEQMPIYIEADDANNSQLLVNGEWKNIVFAWALFFDGHKWKYAETDSERGCILDVKPFETESAAVEYAKNILSKIYLSIKSNSKAEMLCRFIQKKFGYSGKRANTMVNQMAKHTDVFEEFFNYVRVGRFCKKDRSQTQVHGYTAEFLSKEYNLFPLGAYNYLVYLIEDPERALADLKAGLSTRDSSKSLSLMLFGLLGMLHQSFIWTISREYPKMSLPEK